MTLDPATAYYERRMYVTRDRKTEEVRLREANQFALQMDHMSECVMEDREPRTPGAEGLQDVRLMQAIYEAARTGRPVRP